MEKSAEIERLDSKIESTKRELYVTIKANSDRTDNVVEKLAEMRTEQKQDIAELKTIVQQNYNKTEENIERVHDRIDRIHQTIDNKVDSRVKRYFGSVWVAIGVTVVGGVLVGIIMYLATKGA